MHLLCKLYRAFGSLGTVQWYSNCECPFRPPEQHELVTNSNFDEGTPSPQLLVGGGIETLQASCVTKVP